MHVHGDVCLCRAAEKQNYALDRSNNEEHVWLKSDRTAPLVALAFKLQESRFGQLTYMRIYQGQLKRGDYIHNADRKMKVKVGGKGVWQLGL